MPHNLTKICSIAPELERGPQAVSWQSLLYTLLQNLHGTKSKGIIFTRKWIVRQGRGAMQGIKSNPPASIKSLKAPLTKLTKQSKIVLLHTPSSKWNFFLKKPTTEEATGTHWKLFLIAPSAIGSLQRAYHILLKGEVALVRGALMM